MQVKLLGARLSSNPDTGVTTHLQGVNGSVNITGTGKKFFVIDYQYMKAGLIAKKGIMVWADDNDKFITSAADYNDMKVWS